MDFPLVLVLRQLLLRLLASSAKCLSLTIARALLPLHRMTWNQKRGRWRLRQLLQKFSPLVDYYDSHPQRGEKYWRSGRFSIRMTLCLRATAR